MAKVVFAEGSEVRAWGAEKGLAVKSGEGVRGRLPKSVIADFEAATGKTYRPASKAPAHTVEVSAKPEKGRTVKRKVQPSVVRAWATEKGLTEATKGRLSADTYKAYVLAGGK